MKTHIFAGVFISSLCIIKSYDSSAQGTLAALEAKNGFRDAKFGMPLSSFKDMRLKSKADSINNTPYKVYIRLSDKKFIGDIALNEIKYTFYKDKLYEINYLVKFGEKSLINTLSTTYGPPKSYIPRNKAEAAFYEGDKGYIWRSQKVEMICWVAQYTTDNYLSTASVTIKSLVLEGQIERSLMQKRASDL